MEGVEGQLVSAVVTTYEEVALWVSPLRCEP